jgi:hypothetical protein
MIAWAKGQARRAGLPLESVTACNYRSMLEPIDLFLEFPLQPFHSLRVGSIFDAAWSLFIQLLKALWCEHFDSDSSFGYWEPCPFIA